MQIARLVSLAFVTAVVLAAAWFVSVRNAPQTEIEQPPLYPSLVDRANDVATVTIRSADYRTELERREDGWVVANRGGYPALVENVRRLVVNIASLRIIEGKTRLPERYHRLQVRNVDDEGARSTLVTLRDDAGEVLVDLIVGKRRSSAITGDDDALYVRPVGQVQALLVSGSPGVTARPSDWMNAVVVDIDADRIRAITIEHADGERLHISRPGQSVKDYALDQVPAGFEVRSSALLTSLATALHDLRFDDVTATAELSLPDTPAVTARYETFDGLVATVRLFEAGGEMRALLHFETTAGETGGETGDAMAEQTAGGTGGDDDAPDPGQEAARLNERTDGWAYVLPKFKRNMMTKRREDLLLPTSPEPAPAGAPPSADPAEPPPVP